MSEQAVFEEYAPGSRRRGGPASPDAAERGEDRRDEIGVQDIGERRRRTLPQGTDESGLCEVRWHIEGFKD